MSISNTEQFINSLLDDNFVKSKECLGNCIKEKMEERIGGMIESIRSKVTEKENRPARKSEIAASAGLKADNEYKPKTRDKVTSGAITVDDSSDMHKRNNAATKSWKVSRHGKRSKKAQSKQFDRPDKK